MRDVYVFSSFSGLFTPAKFSEYFIVHNILFLQISTLSTFPLIWRRQTYLVLVLFYNLSIHHKLDTYWWWKEKKKSRFLFRLISKRPSSEWEINFWIFVFQRGYAHHATNLTLSLSKNYLQRFKICFDKLVPNFSVYKPNKKNFGQLPKHHGFWTVSSQFSVVEICIKFFWHPIESRKINAIDLFLIT